MTKQTGLFATEISVTALVGPNATVAEARLEDGTSFVADTKRHNGEPFQVEVALDIALGRALVAAGQALVDRGMAKTTPAEEEHVTDGPGDGPVSAPEVADYSIKVGDIVKIDDRYPAKSAHGFIGRVTRLPEGEYVAVLTHLTGPNPWTNLSPTVWLRNLDKIDVVRVTGNLAWNGVWPVVARHTSGSMRGSVSVQHPEYGVGRFPQGLYEEV